MLRIKEFLNRITLLWDNPPLALVPVDSKCTICFDSASDERELDHLPCGHKFHRDCIVRWLNCSNVCPNCRHQVHQVAVSTSMEDDASPYASGVENSPRNWPRARPPVSTYLEREINIDRAINSDNDQRWIIAAVFIYLVFLFLVLFFLFSVCLV